MTVLGASSAIDTLASILAGHAARSGDAGRVCQPDKGLLWNGTASIIRTATQVSLAGDLGRLVEAVGGTSGILSAYAADLRSVAALETRASNLISEADWETSRWLAGSVGERPGSDPGSDLRRQAAALSKEARDVHEAAARRAAGQLGAATQALAGLSGGASKSGTGGAGGLGFGGIGPPSPGDILDALGDAAGQFGDWAGGVINWTGDQAGEFLDWAEDRAEDLVEWTGERVDHVEGWAAAAVEELRWQALRGRAQLDFATFLATGNPPNELPGMSESRRRNENLWSYALIPLIEDQGGACTTIDNGLVACHAEGIELPIANLTVPHQRTRGHNVWGGVRHRQ